MNDIGNAMAVVRMMPCLRGVRETPMSGGRVKGEGGRGGARQTRWGRCPDMYIPIRMYMQSLRVTSAPVARHGLPY